METGIIKYWETGCYYREPHQLFTLIPSEDVKLGEVLLSPPHQKDYKIWVAPFVFSNEKNEHQVPILLPANYQFGKIWLRKTPLLPWISKRLNISKAFHDWCFNVFFNEAQVCELKTWQSYYEAVVALLDENADWKSLFEENGFKLNQNSACLWQSETAYYSQLLKRYASLEPSSQIDFSDIHENAHLFCASNPDRPILSKQDYQTLLHVLICEKENFLAIETPIGSNAPSLIDAIASSKSVYALAHDYPLTQIYRLKGENLENFTFNQFSDKDKLMDLYQEMMSGLNLADKLNHAKEKEEALEAQIASFQLQDEALEKRLDSIYQENQAQKKTFKERWQAFFKGQSNQLSETIRQIKVERTKIHQQLVELVDKKSNYRLASQHWKQWCQTHNIQPQEDPHQAMASKLYSLLNGRWEKVEGLLALKQKKGDKLLIIEEAHRLSCAQMIDWMQEADWVILMGCSQEYSQKEKLDAMICQQLLLDNQLLTDDNYDELHYRGMLLSTGNAWRVGMTHRADSNPLVLTKIESKHPTILSFCNSFLETKLTSLKYDERESSIEGIQFYPTNGHSHAQGNECVNPAEAKMIYDKLLKNSTLLCDHSVVVVTLFHAQRELLQQVLRDVKLSIEFYTADEIPSQVWDVVIFSTVLTSKDPRPYEFDQNDTFFYGLASRSRRGFWIVGESALYNSKMRSPSGKLAKFFSSIREVESIALESF